MEEEAVEELPFPERVAEKLEDYDDMALVVRDGDLNDEDANSLEVGEGLYHVEDVKRKVGMPEKRVFYY